MQQCYCLPQVHTGRLPVRDIVHTHIYEYLVPVFFLGTPVTYFSTSYVYDTVAAVLLESTYSEGRIITERSEDKKKLQTHDTSTRLI